MDRKGLELPFSAIITGFFLLAAAVLVYLILYARILDVHVIVLQSDAEIHTIDMAQVLLSSEKLVYSDDGKLYRGIFDKTKLDTQLENLDVWYPDVVAEVGIEDKETGERWKTFLVPDEIGGTSAENLINCLIDTVKIDITMIFRVPRLSPWEWPDLEKCFTENLANQITPYTRDFPVAIRISDNEIHEGRMVVSSRELFFGD